MMSNYLVTLLISSKTSTLMQFFIGIIKNNLKNIIIYYFKYEFVLIDYNNILNVYMENINKLIILDFQRNK